MRDSFVDLLHDELADMVAETKMITGKILASSVDHNHDPRAGRHHFIASIARAHVAYGSGDSIESAAKDCLFSLIGPDKLAQRIHSSGPTPSLLDRMQERRLAASLVPPKLPPAPPPPPKTRRRPKRKPVRKS